MKRNGKIKYLTTEEKEYIRNDIVALNEAFIDMFPNLYKSKVNRSVHNDYYGGWCYLTKKGEEMVQIRNFKIPHDCHECVVKNRGVCDIPLDDVVKYPTYISKRHPNCPIEPTPMYGIMINKARDFIRRKK